MRIPRPPFFLPVRSTLRAGTIGIAAALAGCFGVVAVKTDYAPISVSLTTADQAVAALGRPLRKSTSGDEETWFYKLNVGLAGKEVDDTLNGVAVGVPILSHKVLPDNLQLVFREGRLVSASERLPSGFASMCGFWMNPEKGPKSLCEGESLDGSTKAMSDTKRIEAAPSFDLAAIAEDCNGKASEATGAACRLARYGRALAPALLQYPVKLLDQVYYFNAVPTSPEAAKAVGFAEIRIGKNTGIVGTRKPPKAD